MRRTVRDKIPKEILRAYRYDYMICGYCGVNVMNSVNKNKILLFNPHSNKFYVTVKVTVIDNGKIIITVELVSYEKQTVPKAYRRKLTDRKIIRVK
jgi:hypothetical protein